MRMLTLREAALALFTFVLGITATSALRAAENSPFQVVDGDGWLTSNADFANGAWTARNVQRPAFGLQLSERNDLPFDRGTAGATFWVHNADCAVTFGAFGEPCGWQMGLAITQFRSLVVGGDGMEIDGLGAPPPYVRIVNSTQAGTRLAGLLTNAFVDFSGVDAPGAPSWFGGFDLARDAFVVRRAAEGAQRFDDLFTVDHAGNARVGGALAAGRAEQSAPNRWAARAQLVDGSYTLHFAAPFAQPPVCIASSEGSARVRVTPHSDGCVVTSENPHDTATVDVVAIGNPD
jgi:hypothetical protein